MRATSRAQSPVRVSGSERILSARAIESELLVTYAVDPLRELVGGRESRSRPDDERDDQLYPGVRARLLRLSELDVVCATGAFELRDPRLEPLPFGDVADTSVVACSSGPSLAMS